MKRSLLTLVFILASVLPALAGKPLYSPDLVGTLDASLGELKLADATKGVCTDAEGLVVPCQIILPANFAVTLKNPVEVDNDNYQAALDAAMATICPANLCDGVTNGLYSNGHWSTGMLVVWTTATTTTTTTSSTTTVPGSSTTTTTNPVAPLIDTGTPPQIATTGTTITITFDQNMTTGTDGSTGFDVDLNGGSDNISVTYSNGTGTAVWVFTLGQTIESYDTVDLDFTQPGDGMQASDDNTVLATITNVTVTNSSTVTTTSTTTTTLASAINNFGDFNWNFAWDADNPGTTACGGSACGDTDTVTSWDDIGNESGTDNLVAGTGPAYNVDGCGTSPNHASLDFVTTNATYLENTSLACADGNHRCQLVIIGKFTDNTGADYIFSGEGGGETTNIYTDGTYYKYHAGTAQTDSSPTVDTNLHVLVWDMDGTTGGTTPWCQDSNCDNTDAGTGAPTTGITIGANSFGSGSYADYQFCAIGLYEGNLKGDTDYCALRAFVYATWGVYMEDNSCP